MARRPSCPCRPSQMHGPCLDRPLSPTFRPGMARLRPARRGPLDSHIYNILRILTFLLPAASCFLDTASRRIPRLTFLVPHPPLPFPAPHLPHSPSLMRGARATSTRPFRPVSGRGLNIPAMCGRSSLDTRGCGGAALRPRAAVCLSRARWARRAVEPARHGPRLMGPCLGCRDSPWAGTTRLDAATVPCRPDHHRAMPWPPFGHL